MRLEVLERDHQLAARAFQKLAAVVFWAEDDDVAKTAMHRPGFFGRWFNDLLRPVLRGPSPWTPAERECIAVRTSKLNQCPFCVRVHTETARRIASRGELNVDAER